MVLIHFTHSLAFINLTPAPSLTTSPHDHCQLLLPPFTMASSSSASSVISYESETTREPTPEYDPISAYKVRAPLHWDAEEWDFHYQSEDDASLTDGEDLTLLLMVRISHSSSEPSWRKRKTMPFGEKTFLSQRKNPIPSPPRKIRWQVPFFLTGHRTILPTAAKEPTMMTASPAAVARTTMMATMVAAAVALALLHHPSAARPLMCTGGRP
jgi:hypothetical protein